MSLRECIRVSLRALGANKLRALLTMLGIIIGVAAVIALMAMGRGAQAAITQQIQSLGTNVLFVRPGASTQSGVRQSSGSQQTLTLEDGTALAEQVPAVKAVAPELNGNVQLVANGQNWSTRVIGTSASYPEVRNAKTARGQFFTREQEDNRASVIVLGQTVVTNLFPGQDPIGQSVRVSMGGRPGVMFRVIGVMESKGGSGFGNQDDQAFVPVTSFATRLSATRTAHGQLSVGTLNVQVDDQASVRDTMQQVSALLRQRHKVTQDDFTVQSQEDFLQTISQVSGTMTIFLGAIAGISLIVGGIGIMNIMLVSVTERTREIGIRKAIGARRRDILLQFMVEAMVVSVLGGVIGISVGVGVSRVVGRLPLPGMFGSALVTPDAVVLAFTVSAAIGMFFGIYPAMRASRLRPIEALRYE
ncbi:MAG TPA: ABC transporter permease [Chloroflexota bacterium]|nr:ABC transporter permease [Chloroflexota bacterium]